MIALEGHICMGFVFFVLGFWHLFNYLKLHFVCSSNTSLPFWFPTKISRYLELYFIVASCAIFSAAEIFEASSNGTIPTNHIHQVEHTSITVSFFIYATFAIILDRKKSTVTKKTQYEITLLLAAIAFGQEFLLFHLHSRSHMGIEGQYHYCLQVLILIGFVTTLMGIGFPKSFLVCFVRSVSMIFQGLFIMFMGLVLSISGYQPKGCFLEYEGDQLMIRCNDEKAMHRAVSLVNLQFSWFFIGVTVFAVSFYLIMAIIYGEKVECDSLMKEEQYGEGDGSKNFDVESHIQMISTRMEEKI